MHQFVKQFQEKGYFEYPINDSLRHMLINLSEIWTAFYMQPIKQKEIHHFSEYGGGYEYKGPESRDYKENFHISLKYAIPNKASAVDVTMIYTAQTVIREMIRVVKEMTEIMSEAVGIDLEGIVCKDFHSWVIRLLYYPPRLQEEQQEDIIMAASHIDKGLTTHLFESAPGLQVLWKKNSQDQEKVWHDVIGREGFVHGYLGMLGQLYFHSMFPALCHRVISNNRTITQGRKSGVLFSDFGRFRYDKDTWGPTQ